MDNHRLPSFLYVLYFSDLFLYFVVLCVLVFLYISMSCTLVYPLFAYIVVFCGTI